METKKSLKKKNNPFKMIGSYLGLYCGFILSLQIKANRLFFKGEVTELNCFWKPIESISCSNLILINILFFIFFGFFMGWFVNRLILKKV